MMQGIQNPSIDFTANTASTNGTLPNITTSIRMPYQNTPEDVYKYLKEMDFIHTTCTTGDIWMRKGTSSYFTWEQAVAYCLIKPFLNP